MDRPKASNSIVDWSSRRIIGTALGQRITVLWMTLLRQWVRLDLKGNIFSVVGSCEVSLAQALPASFLQIWTMRGTTNRCHLVDLINSNIKGEAGNNLDALIKSFCLLRLTVFDVRTVNKEEQQAT